MTTDQVQNQNLRDKILHVASSGVDTADAARAAEIFAVCPLPELLKDPRSAALQCKVFQDSCATGDVATVQALLAPGTDNSSLDVHAAGESGFRQACCNGHEAVVKTLLALEGAWSIDVHAMDSQALEYACINGHTEVVRTLLGLAGQREARTQAMGHRALLGACEHGSVEIVRQLLALDGMRRVDVHADSEKAFRCACRRGHAEVVRELLALTGDRAVDVHAVGDDALLQACLDGRDEVLQQLLALTGPRRMHSQSVFEKCFAEACRHGRDAVVQQLLELDDERRVDVHAGQDRAFSLACMRGYVGVVRQLLRLTGDRLITAHVTQPTIFETACRDGHTAVMRELLAATGAQFMNPNTHAGAGAGHAVALACTNGHVAVLRQLLALQGERRAALSPGAKQEISLACMDGHPLVLLQLLMETEEDRRVDAWALLLEAPLATVQGENGDDALARLYNQAAADTREVVRAVLMEQLQRFPRGDPHGATQGGARGLFDEAAEFALLNHRFVTGTTYSAWGRPKAGYVVWRFMAGLVRLAALPVPGLHGLGGALRAALRAKGAMWLNEQAYAAPNSMCDADSFPVLHLSLVARLAAEAQWRGMAWGGEGGLSGEGVALLPRHGRRQAVLRRAVVTRRAGGHTSEPNC